MILQRVLRFLFEETGRHVCFLLESPVFISLPAFSLTLFQVQLYNLVHVRIYCRANYIRSSLSAYLHVDWSDGNADLTGVVARTHPKHATYTIPKVIVSMVCNS